MNATLAPRKTRVSTTLLYSAFALFYLFLGAMVPYAHDDWDWGLPIGMQHLLTADINSRYVGNFFEVIMTRSVILKIVFMSSCYFLLPLLLSIAAQKITAAPKTTRPLFFLFANFLMLTMGLPMWRQTYSWIAGFANFGFSSVFMLLCLMQMIPLLNNEPIPKASAIRCIGFFLLAVAGQLFLENLALFMVLATLAANIVHCKKYKRIHWTYGAMFLGALIGLVIMFSSTVYGTILNTGTAVDGFRSLSFSLSDGFGKIIYNIFYQCMCLAQRGGQFRCAAVVILALLILAVYSLKYKRRNLCYIANGALILFYLIADFLPEKGALWIMIGGGMGFALYGCIFAEVILLFREQKIQRNKMLVLLSCSITLILPFLAIGENGPRVFFPSYVLLVLFALVLTDSIPALQKPKAKKHFTRTLLCAALIVVLILTWCYAGIGMCSYNRQVLIEKAVAQDADTVVLPKYPYDVFLWMADAGEGRMIYFKEFYGIPEDMEVIFQ